MNNNRLGQKWFFISMIIFFAAFSAVTAYYNKIFAIIGGCAVAVFTVLYFVLRKVREKEHFLSLQTLADNLDATKRQSLDSLPMPILLVSDLGAVVWYNDRFKLEIIKALKTTSLNAEDYIGNTKLSNVLGSEGMVITLGNRSYTVYTSEFTQKNKQLHVLYYFDITELIADSINFRKSKASVLIGMYDNFDEMFQSFSESELSELTGGIDREITKWLKDYNCIIRKIGSERFVIVAHESDLSKMESERFSVLNNVKEFIYNGKPCGVTLSIGVGRGDNLRECDSNAKQSLDMALSRGGDQVAVKNSDGYDFYGGIASGVEKNSRVKSRVVASAIKQLINTCSNVLIIGHKFSDYDALGAAIGICSVCKNFGKNANIVYDKNVSLANRLANKYISQSGNNPFIDKRNALARLNDNTLVFLLDTHRASYSEMPELLNNSKMVIVIDHHRKAVDFYRDAVVFHHDSSASSTCEMVAELLPYLSASPLISEAEADAMFSGIMLDTKNFILRAGVRTFDAAAYLKSRGADAVRVKKLFTSSAEEHKFRDEIVSSAVIYRECAIAVSEIKSKDIRIITSQAADELLNISGVKASFVVFKTDDIVNVSARSFGEMNVQVVMENLGGGGHHTMAAAQIKNSDVNTVQSQIKKSVDEYFNNI